MPEVESVLARRVLASGLIEAADLARGRAALGDDADDARLLEWLVKQGLLTKWQMSQIEAGRAQSLVLGHYKLLAPLGAGGMGTVYRALDTKLKRQVALKVLPPRLATPDAVGRFRREALVALQLHHDHVVTSFELAQHGTLHFLAMELVDGPSLSAHLAKQRRLSVRETARIGLEVALALEHAHDQGIVHRDIKPSNILLSRQGRVKVADMGLAKFFGPQSQAGAPETRTGQFMGTIDYCSPEQAVDAKRADIRSDIYSLGCTLYHCLTGQPPFAEGTEVQRIMAHLDLLPASIRVKNRDVPPAFAELIEKRMLAKDPGYRFQTPAEAAQALAPWAREETGPTANLWAGLQGLDDLLDIAAQAPRADVSRAAAPQSVRETSRRRPSPVTRRNVKLRVGAKDESVLRGPLGWAAVVVVILGAITFASLWWRAKKADDVIAAANTVPAVEDQSGQQSPAAGPPGPSTENGAGSSSNAGGTSIEPPTTTPPAPSVVPRDTERMKLVLDEHFEDPLAGPEISDNDHRRTSLLGGDLQFLSKQPGGFGSNLRASAPGDFVCEVQARVAQAAAGTSWGLLFGVRADDDWFGAFLRDDARAGLICVRDELLPMTSVPAARPFTESNRMRVEVSGKRVRLFVNDAHVGDHVADDYRPGNMLLECLVQQAPVDVRFERVRLWLDEANPSPPPTPRDLSGISPMIDERFDERRLPDADLPPAKLGYVDGDYYVLAKQAGFWGTEVVSKERLTDDYVCEVEARLTTPAVGGWGLFFAKQNDQSGLLAQLRNGGRAALASWDSGYPLIPWRVVATAHSLTDVNTLRVEVRGRGARLFVNGEYLGDVEDERCRTGALWLVAASDGGPVEARFQRLRVWCGPSDVVQKQAPLDSEALRRRGAKILAKGFAGSWSPDSQQIVYSALPGGAGIDQLDIASGKITRLITPGLQPAFSPSGKTIAYMRGQGINEEVWLADADGSNGRKLVDGGMPHWAKDGKTLYFHSRKEGKIKVADVTKARIVAKDFAPCAKSLYPAVSPDGKYVAYVEGGSGKLVVLSINRKQWVEWAPHTLTEARGGLVGWSPDSKRVGYGGFGAGGPDSVGLWVFDLPSAEDLANIRVKMNQVARDGFRKPAPENLFAAANGKVNEILAGQCTMPSWSRDGKWLAFDVRCAGDWELWAIETKQLSASD
jgi:serine/threonine protein kinase